jgi:hypothetical protein
MRGVGLQQAQQEVNKQLSEDVCKFFSLSLSGFPQNISALMSIGMALAAQFAEFIQN